MSPLKRFGFLLAAALLIVPFAPPAAADSPIQPGNRPTPVPGGTNGQLPSSDLIGVAPGCQAARAAGPSLGLLLSTARGKGVALGTEQCYRPLSDQVTQQQAATAAGNSACAAPVASGPSGPVGTSMHGWGKAADFFDSGGSLTFGSPGYSFLQANAGRFGWNHPGWAQPGGSACPEAWHWEWVGDGGTVGATPVRADVVALLPTADGQGYSTVTGLGAMVNRGDAIDRGSAAAINLNWLMVGSARTAGGGYWMVGLDGGVFTFGDAGFFGSTGALRLNQPIVGMAATPDGQGYWLVAADGGIFTFGDARFFGSTGAMRLNRAIVGMASTPDGGGYWLVAADGGIFTFGDARFFGSTGGGPLTQPITGMAATPSGAGYWLVAADGGIFTFGDAPFAGSLGGQPAALPVVGVAPTHSGHGYWTIGADGTVSAFGDAGSFGPG
jgi:hypothetical protein